MPVRQSVRLGIISGRVPGRRLGGFRVPRIFGRFTAVEVSANVDLALFASTSAFTSPKQADSLDNLSERVRRQVVTEN
jgi:hypothetical protein